MKVAIVGATGLVGRTIQQILQERNFPVDELTLYASARSVGKSFEYKSKTINVIELKDNNIDKFDFVFFSAGAKVSREYAPKFAQKGAIVIDNSSAWRMDDNIPLVVPEVNQNDAKNNNIIANPNCSTIQLVVALKPLEDAFGLKKVIVSTYQSISGAGQKGLNQLHNEQNGIYDPNIKHPIFSNAIFHPVSTEDPNWTIEEIKMINESRKILHLPNLAITVTCVRLPIEVGHSEAVYLETKRNTDANEIKEILTKANGVIVLDNLENEDYPTPLMTKDRDEVFVGRIRKDLSSTDGFWFWVVANNVRKGAASNAIQIAEGLLK
ncbi:MAG TPA: aspartate-semialdehyde dehydrogenase [Bacteroidota bacterium]|nr:aspartate-semialdehyde dehydrogenase [Candidatus Kapabacteria bacterium]HRS01325.1 aspartate-semialdehyde dehydrogenase [Bacteroidota bacterium]